MEFKTLKDFWEWLTISTGDIETDKKSLLAYFRNEDFNVLNEDEKDIFMKLLDIYRLIKWNEQELQLP